MFFFYFREQRHQPVQDPFDLLGGTDRLRQEHGAPALSHPPAPVHVIAVGELPRTATESGEAKSAPTQQTPGAAHTDAS